MKLYVRWKTGSPVVPMVVTDGEVISESQRIVAWAQKHPGASASSAA